MQMIERETKALINLADKINELDKKEKNNCCYGANIVDELHLWRA